MKKLNADVVYNLARKVARASNVFDNDHEERDFDEDPELWVVGFFLAALEELREKSSTLGDVVQEASYEHNQEKARRMLGRKKVAIT